MLEAILAKKSTLTPTETTIKHIGGSVQVVSTGQSRPESSFHNQTVLLLSKNWLIYQWLNPKITKVLITSQTSYHEMQGRLDALKGYQEIIAVDDFDSGVVEYHAVRLNAQYGFTHVACLSEGDLIRAARLRERFGIQGEFQTVESALRYRDKFVMKSMCLDAGLSVPAFASVENVCDVLDFVDRCGMSVVVKPRKGYGSVNTHVIKDQQSLMHCIETTFTNNQLDEVMDLEIESFVNGQMYHIDGVVYDGEVKFVWPSQYVNTVVNFKENPFIAGFSCSKENPVTARLQKYIVDVISVLEGPPCFPFHAEAWHTDDDDIVLCEIASRGGGGGIKLQMLESSGISMDKLWMQYQCDDYILDRNIIDPSVNWENRFPHTLVGWVYMYPSIGLLVRIPDDCDLDFCLGYIPYATDDTYFDDRDSCFDAVAQILVKGETEEELKDRIEQVNEWWKRETIWQDTE
eukprot:TRINITY_DN7299_c0_g1_i1.p1 TRINITY_DN7299_c0_g1~~TRINITY_DN7299_c0_g1_i1.p1  ORF type:complete len:491 (+),score=90.97 TRINITY_DN7299_c0_g1_i1:93-1475(+)